MPDTWIITYTYKKVITAINNALTLQPKNLLMLYNYSAAGVELTDSDFSNLMWSYGKQADTHTHTERGALTVTERQAKRKLITVSSSPPSTIIENTYNIMWPWAKDTHTLTHNSKEETPIHLPHPLPVPPTWQAPYSGGWKSLSGPQMPTIPSSFIHPVQSARQNNGD